MSARAPEWVNPRAYLRAARSTTPAEALAAIAAPSPGLRELACLLSPAAARLLEPMAQRAQALTRRHFGKTISLYVPLYLSNFCVGGCAYCGFASDRRVPRRRLEPPELKRELDVLELRGFEDLLLLTGERSARADFPYLLACVETAARRFHQVTVESFAMTFDEYRQLADAGCTGITIYQETYHPALYHTLHRWGPKRDYGFRLAAPERAMAAGLRSVGLGALLGLADPAYDVIALCRHVMHLRRESWSAGVSVSFPRVCHQRGDYRPAHPISDARLAQIIFACRLCLPDVPLVLSTRETPAFRDGMAGVGISRMSASSRTTVGGYRAPADPRTGQFEVSDARTVREFCAALRRKGLDPVFKNWDAVFHRPSEGRP